MTSGDPVEVVPLEDRRRWEAEHSLGGLPSQSWSYAWALSLSGVSPQLAVVQSSGSRMLLPFFERDWNGATDVASILGLSGASIEPPSRAPLAAWRDYARARGWVAGYLQLSPLTRAFPADGEDEFVRVNSVFLLDLTDGDALRAAGADVRRKARRAEQLGVELVTGGGELRESLLRLYPAAMRRSGARDEYVVAPETLERWIADPSSVAVGARIDGEIGAVSLFSVAGKNAESHITVASPGARWASAWLVWKGSVHLRAEGVALLNLGGGVRPGDGIYRFKERFHGEERPLLAVRQVYDRDAYERLCRESGVEPGDGPRFPTYRYAGEA